MEIDRSLCDSSWKSVGVGGSQLKSVEVDMEASGSQRTQMKVEVNGRQWK